MSEKPFFPKTVLFSLPFIVIAITMGLPIIEAQKAAVVFLWTPIVFWLLGGLIGYATLNLDRLVDIYFTNPETKLSYYVRDYFAKGKYWQGWQLMEHNKKLQKRLTFRSALFQIVWVFLALFSLTSIPSFFSKGLILGIGYHLLLDEWELYLHNKDNLKYRLFWNINRPITNTELQVYLVIMTLLTCLFFLLVI